MDRDTLAVLGGCSLFRGLPPEEIDRLCACLGGRVRSCARGEALWLTGDAVADCGVVLRGRVRAEHVTGGGRRDVTAVQGPGAVFGDVLMATPSGRSPVDVLAAEDSELLFLPFARIMGGCGRCCAAHETLRENLLGEISEKFWALRRQLRYLSARSLRARIALRLLDAAKASGADTFSLGCSREELADGLGANRSALSRELSRMRADGLIDCYRDGFRLLDRAALRRCADR